MDHVLASYVRKHTLIVATIIVFGFLFLAAGEYYLYRKQMQLNLMLSQGLIQLKEGQQSLLYTPSPTMKVK